MSDRPPTYSRKRNEIQRLLASAPLIGSPCELDLLGFLHRHPRTLLTNEQIAAFVGYDRKQVAKAVDAFVDAGLLERTQSPLHAARMYLLVLEGPHRGGLQALIKLSSTRQGREEILQLLDPRRSQQPPLELSKTKRRLHVIA